MKDFPKKNFLQTDLAVALSYQEKAMDAPIVEAVGERKLALMITRLARRYGVPISNNTNLAQALAALAPQEEIPPELYQEVAEIFQKIGTVK